MRAEIATPRLRLRPVAVEEAGALYGGERTGLVLGDGHPHADTHDALAMTVVHGAEPGWFVTLGGVVIGDCGTHGAAGEHGALEIGYGLAAPFRGNGSGTEVVAALSTWLLGQPGVRSVTADVLADSMASCRVLEKTGFAMTEESRSHVMYGLRSR